MAGTEDPTISAFLQRHSTHRPGNAGIAVFDCDYTLINGDIGEAMFYRQIREFLFRLSPADVWTDHPRRKELDRLFRTLSGLPPERRPAHPAFIPFADMLLSWYSSQLSEGKVEKGCADIVRLFGGFTPSEVRAIADATYEEELSAPCGRVVLGTQTVPRGIRYFRETADLCLALREVGFSLWTISGSNAWSVEPVFRPFGVSPEQVIGISLVEKEGTFTPVPEEPVPIRHKKVEALRKRTGEIPLLVASDSRNDVPILEYASELRVYVNSHGRETASFFASSGIARDSSWAVIESPTVTTGVPRHG